MSYNCPNVGEVISKWDMTEPYKCTEGGPSEGGKMSTPLVGESMSDLTMDKPANANTSATINGNGDPRGDNPSLSFDVSLPSQGDLRVKGPSPSSNPTPGKVGA